MNGDKKFKDLSIGDKFEVYGDEHLNYNFPKICLCKKISDDTGEEIEAVDLGNKFLMNSTDIVYAIGE